MKKVISLLILAIMALVGVDAAADTCSFTVKVNDPELCNVQVYQATESLRFDSNNEATVTFGDNVSTYMRIILITPVTPSGQEKVYYKSYRMYDSEGELLKEQLNINATNRKNITIGQDLDGGVLDLEFGTMSDSKMIINITGNPSKVDASLMGTKITGLKAGANEVTFSPTITLLYIKPVGQSKFYSVKYNGSDVVARIEGGEGATGSYSYTINKPADGSVLDIVTDYPDNDCRVTFECNDPSFFSLVTVNDSPVENFLGGITVKCGDEVSVSGDGFNYAVRECGVNGVAAANVSYSQSRVIEGDTNFYWDVAAIERGDNFLFYAQPGSSWYLLPSNLEGGIAKGFDADDKGETGDGFTLVPLRSLDNPWTVSVQNIPEGVGEDFEIYIFQNDQLVEKANPYAPYRVTAGCGDIVKAYVGTKRPATYRVTYTLEGLSRFPTIIKDHMEEVDGERGSEVLPGTPIAIIPDTEERIDKVIVNNKEVGLSDDGSYLFHVDNADAHVTIVGLSDGVVDVPADEVADHRVYNLQGIVVDHNGATSGLPAGVYIRGGKKIIVK